MTQQTVKLEYNSEVVIGAKEDSKDAFIQGYHKIEELKYILEVDTETVTGLVVGIKTLLDIIFIALQNKRKKK